MIKALTIIACLMSLTACATTADIQRAKLQQAYQRCVKRRTEIFDIELVSAYNNGDNSTAFDDLIETRTLCLREAQKGMK